MQILRRHVKVNCHNPMVDLHLEGEAKKKKVINLLFFMCMSELQKKFLKFFFVL
jgi:hypothetical protein